MTPWERAWLIGVSLIAGLALVVACVSVAHAQSADPAVVFEYAQIIVDARNRCEGDAARLRAELVKLREQIERLSKPQEAPTPK